jgi:hypothetical protein
MLALLGRGEPDAEGVHRSVETRTSSTRGRAVPSCHCGAIAYAAAPATPSVMTDRSTVRFLISAPLLRVCAHREWHVDLTNRFVDAAWLCRRFESIGEQVGLQRK